MADTYALILRTGEQIMVAKLHCKSIIRRSHKLLTTPNQHGSIAYLVATQTVSGAITWKMFDPVDGTWVFNMTNVPSGTMSYGPNGEPIIYQFNRCKQMVSTLELYTSA